MDISSIKEFLKTYSSLLVPVVIGLVGVLLFVPTQLMSSKLNGQIESDSISKGGTIRSLGGVVSQYQWKVEQDYQRAHKADANKMALKSLQSSQRQLLSYEIFPEPKDTSVLIFNEFGRRFRNCIEDLVNRLHAGECPSEAQLSKISKGWSSRRWLKQYQTVGATVRERFCLDKAESISVYANPADMSGYGFWVNYNYADSEGKDEAIKDCWYSQLAYWIIEDVFNTVAVMNRSSSSVLTSPVKRVFNVSFGESQGSSRNPRGKSSSGKQADRPSYIFSSEEGLTMSCTRRFCSKDIDVLHFKLAVVVSARAVLPFMQELCSAKEHKFAGWDGSGQERTYKHNQITILGCEVSPVLRKKGKHNLYRYGEDAVVELELTCEYILEKVGYDKAKPDVVKKEIEDKFAELEKKKSSTTTVRTMRKKPRR